MNWRLLAGRLRDAWQAYPGVRRRYLAIPEGPHIFVTGAHRSGTTWLAKMLAASGIWYVHEPFGPKKGRWRRSFRYRRSAVPDPAADALFDEILTGGFRAALNMPDADHPLMPLRLFNPGFKRLLVKDPLACLMTEYLTRRYNLQTVILFRHPAGFVSSVNRLGWPRGSFLQQFLEDEPLMAEHLAPHRALLEKYSGEDSVASAAVLHGALNCVLWDFVKQGVGTPLHFEALCADPLEQLRQLFQVLALPYDDHVRAAHHAACYGKKTHIDAYHPHSVSRDSLSMASSWKAQLGHGDIARIRGIWEAFGLPMYQSEADWQTSETDRLMTP